MANKKIWIFGIVAAIMAALSTPFDVSAQRGEKTLGIRAGYNTRNESAMTGIYFQYRFSKHFRIAPNADYIFRHHGTDALSVNGNVHFPFALSPRWNIYPLAGINFTMWNHRSENLENTDDVSTRSNKFGLNAGGGLEWYATPTLKIMLEGKYCWVKDFDTGAITLGIGYVF